MSERLADQLERSGYGAPGFAERYDGCRPRPPAVLLEWLPALARVGRPALVVDLGSGTGLSTRPWAERANEVVGVEPNDAMRAHARRTTRAPNVRFAPGSSYDTGLGAHAADVVTCAQSLQWMEPGPTFGEIDRVLRPGGVFAAYEYVALQTPFWEPEAAWREVRARTGRLRRKLGWDEGKPHWPVSLERLEGAGCFADCRELLVHSVEEGNAERLVELALSEGSLTTLLAAEVSEADVGLDRLRETAKREMGSRPCPWLISYKVWVGRTPTS